MTNLSYTRDNDLPFGEVTTTENLLFDLSKANLSSIKQVKGYSIPAENKNGADWMISITQHAWTVEFRFQAKRLYPSGRYDALKERQKIIDQRDKLIQFANQDGVFPLYLFYNHDQFTHPMRGPERLGSWGCSIASPRSITGKTYPKPDEISPMWPWETLVCDLGSPKLRQGIVKRIHERLKKISESSNGAVGGSSEDIPHVQIPEPRRGKPEWTTFSHPEQLKEYARSKKCAGLLNIQIKKPKELIRIDGFRPA